MEKYSTALRNWLASGGSLRDAMKNGKLKMFSGSQPTDADSAEQGTNLVNITNAGGAWTAETRAVGSVRVTGSTVAGSLTGINVASLNILPTAVTWSESNSSTASLIAAQVNKDKITAITAEWSGEYVNLKAPYGAGAVTWAVSSVASGTLTKTDSSFSGGVAAANGLDYALASGGAVAKAGSWSGSCIAGGSAGWFRLCGAETDAGGGSNTANFRVDGTITSTGGGGDLTLTSTTLALNAPITIDSFSLNMEATGR